MLLLVLYLMLSTFLLSLLITPVVRDFFVKRGMVDKPDTHRKLHKIAVPRVGGLAIFIAYAISMFSAFILPFHMSDYFGNTTCNIAGIIIAISVVFLAGLLDDLFQLKPWQKLLLITVASLIAFFSGVSVQFFGSGFGTSLMLPVSILWLIGCTNAFNLIDGMDGLASGVGFVSCLTIFLAAVSMENSLLILLTVPLLGVLLGFLRYNFFPASIFLGDCGSLTIGFMLGCFGALWSQKAATVLGLSAPILALAVPFVDVALAILRRFLRNQSIFEGDASHIHHLLLRRGLSVRGAAVLLYGVCSLAAIASLSVTTLQRRSWGMFVVILFGVFVWVAIQQLKYKEFSVARRLFFTSDFRKLIDAQTRLEHLKDRMIAANSIDEFWIILKDSVHQFHFLGVRLCIDGCVYEEIPEDIGRKQHWQLRIPLSNNQHANFYRSFGDQVSPLMINLFVQAVDENLRRIVKSSRQRNNPKFSTSILTDHIEQEIA